ncbi:hypothetical protein Q5424_23460 [Conexibacter sp. JD483]|uniref:hypothetical protein n=1 Tax=unclassified Conexibacter TaxID=2627773 RepID=UPI002726A5C0|nr:MULTISPECIES: hypothetical protein [unclassified Conexibacter]MDO8185670.1 hypothetical protein [Conexibacter sp. CPCC 205706]MDO8198843.1 hypothetical protein [Conexibacter sp. CPCC 205762]MDR9372076.1 hypothetical protein [Conexibacter sp. JD483]
MPGWVVVVTAPPSAGVPATTLVLGSVRYWYSVCWYGRKPPPCVAATLVRPSNG